MVSVLPLTVFYTAYSLAGLTAGTAAALVWYYLMVGIRLVRKQPILTAMVLGAGLLTVRTVTTWLTGSAMLYFLQPVIGTVATATAIAATALVGRPMLDRLAHEFCPVPEELSHRLRQRRFFGRLSIVWSLTYVVNALGTVWLLTASSMSGFLVLKTILSPILTGVALVVSYALLRFTLRHEGVRLRWGARTVPA
jgi:intracellular septation protein A